MSEDEAIPNSYEQWRYCIEVKCRIQLTGDFSRARLSELQNGSHTKTKEFARIYGAKHLQQTITWFQRAADEVGERSGGRLRA